MNKLWMVVFGLLTIVFLLHYWLVGQAVYGDGIYYWSYVRSIVIDQDLDTINELRHTYNPIGNNTTERVATHPASDREIMLSHHLPIGPAISWFPFFIIAQIIGLFFSLLHIPVLLNGYSDLYQILVGIGNVLYATIGISFIYRSLEKFYSKKISIFVSLLILFASNLFYYSSIDAINSHPFSFFLSSMFIYIWLNTQKKRLWFHWIILGGITGFLTMTRTQEIVFVSILFADGILSYLKEKKTNYLQFILKRYKQYFLYFLGLFLVISPQLLMWHIFYNGLLNSPYVLGEESFFFFSPHLLGLITNQKTGILYTSPIFLVGFVGLLFLLRKKYQVFLPLIVMVFLEYYIIASWISWDQAASYGIRMLLASVPIIAFGVAELVQRIVKKISFSWVIRIGVCLIILNFLMILRFHLVIKDPTYSGDTITRVAAMNKLNTLFHTNFNWFKE